MAFKCTDLKSDLYINDRHLFSMQKIYFGLFARIVI